MILGAFDIKYMPHTSIKGQVLADLVAKFAESLLEKVLDARHGWKIIWHNISARTFILEGVC